MADGIDEESRSRHSGLVTLEELDLPVTIIGAGSIGSFATLALAKMGCADLTVYDDDEVEIQNIGCQIYGEDHVGSRKSFSCADIVRLLTGIKVQHRQHRWSKNDGARVVVCAVDSNDERKRIWKVLQESDVVQLFIDGRMGGELMGVYVVDMTDTDRMKAYDRVLGRKVDPLPCSERSIVYNTFGISAIIARHLKEFVKGQEVPFETIMDYSSLYLMKSEHISSP